MAKQGWVIPARLRKARERLGLTLKEAAERSGIPEERLRRYEEGEETPTLEEAVTLTGIYRCRLQTFLEPEEEPPARLDLRPERDAEPEERKRLVLQATTDFERLCRTAALIEEKGVAGRCA